MSTPNPFSAAPSSEYRHQSPFRSSQKTSLFSPDGVYLQSPLNPAFNFNSPPMRNRVSSPETPATTKTNDSMDDLPPPPTQSLTYGYIRTPATRFEANSTQSPANILHSEINPGLSSPIFAPNSASRNMQESPLSRRKPEIESSRFSEVERSPLDLLKYGSPVKRAKTPPQKTERQAIFAEPSVALDTWVTIFGFPASKFDAVMKTFESIGQVLVYTKNKKNNGLVNIKYETVKEAQAALSKHGAEISENLIIGVMRTDPSEIPLRIEAIEKREVGWNFTERFCTRRLDAESGPTVQSFHYNLKDSDFKQVGLARKAYKSTVMKAVEFLYCSLV